MSLEVTLASGVLGVMLAQQQLALSAQIDHLNEARKPLVCPAPPVQDTIPDDVSALTEILGRFAALSTATTTTSPTTSSTARFNPSLLADTTTTLSVGATESFMAAIAGSAAAIAPTGPVSAPA
eukprot:CAMPEP_0168172840 /NCGR_PEP_ID=MMETSP0139_2-20121125/5508_1 /TAXON_ID=44445 /ORGANISM="Pseudo-nitzschia australis, Strain 10249 10 AB" /LENGTH=123 /DNA_ID=CAMNT_0008090597 /DNA_START=737 /DNA_END=1107 /DNA_ORIENTATION=-